MLRQVIDRQNTGSEVWSDSAAITTIEMLVRLANALGASTLAEDVETIEQ